MRPDRMAHVRGAAACVQQREKGECGKRVRACSYAARGEATIRHAVRAGAATTAPGEAVGCRKLQQLGEKGECVARLDGRTSPV